MDWEGRREERRRYVEGRVRRVVGKEGVGEGGGGRGEEEVRGLEGVVGRLGEGEGGGGDVEMGG